MLGAFLHALQTAAGRDKRIWLLTSSPSALSLEPFTERFPDRHLSGFASEQTAIGVAAGMAKGGNVCVVCSSPPAAIRCLEQIHDDVCDHDLDVKLFVDGPSGQDLAVLRSMPRMAVAVPADPLEAASIVEHVLATPGPAYVRLDSSLGRPVHRKPLDANPGELLFVREGSDVTLAACGSGLALVLEAARELSLLGIEATVASVPWISPMSLNSASALAANGRIVAVEEHGSGGLFSALAEALAETETYALLRSVRLPQLSASSAGSWSYAGSGVRLATEAIVEKARSMVCGLDWAIPRAS